MLINIFVELRRFPKCQIWILIKKKLRDTPKIELEVVSWKCLNNKTISRKKSQQYSRFRNNFDEYLSSQLAREFKYLEV